MTTECSYKLSVATRTGLVLAVFLIGDMAYAQTAHQRDALLGAALAEQLRARAELEVLLLSYGEKASAVREVRARLAVLERSVPKTVTPAMRQVMVERLRGDLVRLEAQHAELSVRYGQSHPKMAALQRRLALYRAAIRDAGPADASSASPPALPSWAELSVQLIRLTGHLRYLQSRELGPKHPEMVAHQAKRARLRALLDKSKRPRTHVAALLNALQAELVALDTEEAHLRSAERFPALRRVAHERDAILEAACELSGCRK